MDSKYNQNAVIVGYLDMLCLVCEEHLISNDEADKHIVKPLHQKNLTAAPYLESFKNDRIRKVKLGYFCEYCNILLPTSKKVGFHVKDEKHSQSENSQFLRRTDKGVIVNNQLLLADDAYCGLVKDTCAVCNIEFNDQNLHKSNRQHLLNLVQSKVEFEKNCVYRMIDDCSFQCLTCNAIVALNTKSAHFDDAEHTLLYNENKAVYQDYLKIMNEQRLNETSTAPNTELKMLTYKKEVKTTTCDAEDNKDIPTETVSTINDDDDDYTTISSEGTESDFGDYEKSEKHEIKTFAENHKLTYKKGNENVYCRSCGCKIPATLQCMQEHVSGKRHKTEVATNTQSNSQMRSKFSKIRTKRSKIFIEEYFTIGNSIIDDVMIVNEIFCLSLLSFVLISKLGSKYRCLICEINISEFDLLRHIKSDEHDNAFDDIPVVTNEESEFIRRIRPGCYHCGYCDIVVGDWDRMEDHLDCCEHMKNKYNSRVRLQLLKPKVDEYKKQKQMEHYLAMIALFGGMRHPFGNPFFNF